MSVSITMPVTYVPDFMNPITNMMVFNTLKEQLDWERRPDAPRHEYWWSADGRSYTYGRGAGQRTYLAKPEHPLFKGIMDGLEEHMLMRFEGIFLNGYDNEQDSLGWHADDDPQIDHARPIVVVTVGHGRMIQFRAAEKGSVIAEQFLEPGSVLIMHPGMQQTHLHRIPKAGHKVGPRISLTFRGLLP